MTVQRVQYTQTYDAEDNLTTWSAVQLSILTVAASSESGGVSHHIEIVCGSPLQSNYALGAVLCLPWKPLYHFLKRK
jgi:hypothetical protein